MAETIEKITQVCVDRAGPLPVGDPAGQFSTGGGSLLFLASGSGYSTAANRLIGMSVIMNLHPPVGPDGPPIQTGSTQIWANPAFTHLTFPSMSVWRAPGVPAGNYSVQLEAQAGTSSDGNDRYDLTIIEMRP
jgi:hypothetical protein